MGLSARVTRVVGQIGARRLPHGARLGIGNGVGARRCRSVGGTPPFVRHRQVGASLSGLIAGRDPESRVGPAPSSDVCRCSAECAPRAAAAGLVSGAMRPIGERLGDGQRKHDSQESARPLRRHVRPVLKHGPRSLTCERAIEIVESQTRNESEVSSDGTSGDPSSLVAAAHPRATPSAGLLFGALLRRGPRAHTLGPERW